MNEIAAPNAETRQTAVVLLLLCSRKEDRQEFILESELVSILPVILGEPEVLSTISDNLGFDSIEKHRTVQFKKAVSRCCEYNGARRCHNLDKLFLDPNIHTVFARFRNFLSPVEEETLMKILRKRFSPPNNLESLALAG